MKRLICTVAVLLVLCAPARADDGLSMDEAMDIILAHHGVVTDMDVTDYLTLDAESMTREVREHNNFARRVPVLEEQMKVANHRIEDLEELTK